MISPTHFFIYTVILSAVSVKSNESPVDWAANLNLGDDTGSKLSPLEASVVAYTRDPKDDSSVRLALPILEKCRFRPNIIGEEKSYYFSSYDTQSVNDDVVTRMRVNQTFTWLEARNHCRIRCMESVSFESEEEFRNFIELAHVSRIESPMWTSGRLCDFTECDEVEDIEPISVNGWYWGSTRKRLPPTDSVPSDWTIQPWARSGALGIAQPDNAENEKDRATHETCLALVKGPGKKGRHLYHDLTCDRKLIAACEDSEQLLNYMEEKHDVVLKRFP